MNDPNEALASVRSEFDRYRGLAERAMGQLSIDELCSTPPVGLAISSLVWHVAGNLESRFTDFLTSDGEKPWRHRETEFEPRVVSQEELTEKWERGWRSLAEALDALSEDDLACTVTIRGQPWSVIAALHRALPHIAYHVGQIVYTAKAVRGAEWEWLSVAPGGTEAYNRNPTRERG